LQALPRIANIGGNATTGHKKLLKKIQKLQKEGLQVENVTRVQKTLPPLPSLNENRIVRKNKSPVPPGYEVIESPGISANYIRIISSGGGMWRSIEKRMSGKKSRTKRKKENENTYGYIPTGSFVKGVLLTGIDAPTGGMGRGNPEPVLIHIVDYTFLPNWYLFDIKGCFAKGEAFGELSTERVKIKVDNISCIKRDGKIIDAHVDAWVQDVDGKLGLAGHVVTKQGSIIARTLIASFIEGIAKAFNPQNQLNLLYPTVGGTQALNLKTSIEQSLASGASEALSSLAQYYMNLVKQTFPVVEIGAQRECYIVFLRGQKLSFTEKVKGDAYERWWMY
jgi:conjugal transfer pilus assembly protein TraB